MTKKQSLGYYIGRMVLISLISLRRLLRQRGFVSFRLLFHTTAQRVSRCSLPSLRGRGWGEGHFYVFYYLCHYYFCPLCHYGFCIILSVILASVPYVITSSVPQLPCLLLLLSLQPLCLPFILSGLEGYLCKVFLSPYYFVGKL